MIPVPSTATPEGVCDLRWGWELSRVESFIEFGPFRFRYLNNTGLA